MEKTTLPSLLLLPYPPDPITPASLNAAYRPSLTAALAKLKRPTSASKLIVAVVCPILNGQFLRSKTLSWPRAQKLISGLYGLISAICTQHSITIEMDGGPNSVDTTIILIDHDRTRSFTPDYRPEIMPNNTIIIDMPTFANAYHPWEFIFHVRSEIGFEVYQTYLRFAEGKQTLLQEQLIPVEGGLTFNVKTGPASPLAAQAQSPTYSVVCLGGTFDYLHPGHKLLLAAGALLLQIPHKDDTPLKPARYIIGITGDEMLKNKKYAEYVQSWETRARNVLLFLTQLLELSDRGWKDEGYARFQEQDGDFRATFRNGTIEVQCVRIQDPFGPTITVEEIGALVVSGETRSGGQAVNDKRKEQGWKILDVFEVDVLEAEDVSASAAGTPTKTENYESKISSTAIRQQRARAGSRTKI
ncbi:pantetheine-phosphate adenylyltransferase-like protein [Thermochaetoides thermophila DSM 1495]|uniref:Pantetheine-phosphate adenylyltransferase-like protein n=1 Tax=Chaetomium thermophilum (strain DSM 1495 / CBS 144.50 / IMI 039719) TaxID=759272 RepID=G0SAU0_CHATD|nr:pantetheine-phosphate adenylyltransferase-like protein [Thermochaetoides thermophila DSM 1495]EGS19320.1 pantetheine-phosphate adenylyltransferase-like protein [Thermochaetoides thermophila DSM 1495]